MSAPPATPEQPKLIVINGVVCHQLSLREHTPAKVDPVDIRRKRNREAMRRARVRQQATFEQLRATITQLESQLQQLRLQQQQPQEHANTDTDSDPSTVAATDPLALATHQRGSYALLLKSAARLRDENGWLGEQIRARLTQSDLIREFLQQQVTSNFHSEVLDPDGYSLVERALLSQYQFLSHAQVFELVQESSIAILQYARLADACRANTHTVFGWSDKRALDGTWASFMVTKDFPCESAEALADKTWTLSTEFSQYQSVQKWADRMKILQVLNHETLVISRENVNPGDQSRFHTLYLLFRVTTRHGFIVGTRSLNQRVYSGVDAHLIAEQERNRTLTTALYCFIFTRMMEPSAATGEIKEIGCTVQLGGRIGNGNLDYAHNVLMDVLPTTLRWENHCVRPIMSLT